MLIGLFLAMVPPHDIVAEADCVSSGLRVQHEKGLPLDEKAAAADCQTKYGWTNDEAAMAIAVAKATSYAIHYRVLATSSGATEALLDQIFAGFSDQEIAKLGYMGQHLSVQQTVDRNNFEFDIDNRVAKAEPMPAKRDAEQLAVTARGILRNTVRAFQALREKDG